MMKDSGGVKSGDDGSRKVKSENGAEKGVSANGTLSSGAMATITAAAGAGVNSTGAGSNGGDRSKRQVGHFLFLSLFLTTNKYLPLIF